MSPMFTQYTYQDYMNTAEADRPELIGRIIGQYKRSDEFTRAITAIQYFNAENEGVQNKVLFKARAFSTVNGATYKQDTIVGNRVYSNFLFRFITQQNQYLLGNGVTLQDGAKKSKLGIGFDKKLEQMGEKALLHGVCWGYWNNDHVEIIPAASDGLSGLVALLDERTGAPMVGIQFWQLNARRPQYVRLFEADGVTEYMRKDGKYTVTEEKRAYIETRTTDAAGTVSVEGDNYGVLPLVPFYANNEKRSEFTEAISSKIDLYDRIFSDFGDNLERANDVYWVLNNFGGTTKEIAKMIEQINELKVIANISDGVGNNSTAEPHAFEVPYNARKTALELLRKELYKDYMALEMDALTGGSLTNVAIEAAKTDLNLNCDRYEWQAFNFVQGILKLAGIESEQIRFKRQDITNRSEVVQDIAIMRGDIDIETALKLNPYIDQEQIEQIIENRAAEQLSGLPTVKMLETVVE